MKSYETMLVTSAKLDEEATNALVGKFKSLIEKNGTIEAVDVWGKRRLAYPINKEDDGFYTLIYYSAEADFNAELDRRYKITDGVLRSIILARPEGAELPNVKTEEPKAAVKAEEPAAAEEAPAQEAAEEPAAEEPKAEEPKAEEPVAEEPKAEEQEAE